MDDLVKNLRISLSQRIDMLVITSYSIHYTKLYDMGAVISANVTVSFQFPKYAFLLPENERCLGNWMVLPIGLHTDFASSLPEATLI